jgi:hypothetical protein
MFHTCVPNTGAGTIAASTMVDPDSIVLEVTVGLSPDTAVIPDAATMNFGLSVLWGAGTLTPTVPTFTTTHDTSGIDMVSGNLLSVSTS